jgi:hypothetical protein
MSCPRETLVKKGGEQGHATFARAQPPSSSENGGRFACANAPLYSRFATGAVSNLCYRW